MMSVLCACLNKRLLLASDSPSRFINGTSQRLKYLGCGNNGCGGKKSYLSRLALLFVGGAQDDLLLGVVHLELVSFLAT